MNKHKNPNPTPRIKVFENSKSREEKKISDLVKEIKKVKLVDQLDVQKYGY